MRHAVFLALVCLSVCHGAPLRTTPTVPERTVPYPAPPTLPILPPGTPLTTVTTTSEDPPTPTPEAPSTTVTPPTTVPSTVEPFHDLHEAFDLATCAGKDTTCYFLPRCVSPSFVASTNLWLVTVTPGLLSSRSTRRQLEDCPAIAVVINNKLELRRSLRWHKMTLREYGLTIDFLSDDVHCTSCVGPSFIEKLGRVRTDTLALPRRVTEKLSSRSTTLSPTARSTTTTSTTVLPPPLRTITTKPGKTRGPQPMPVPRTPSLSTDPANIQHREAAAECKEEGTSPWSIAVVCLLVLVAVIFLGLIAAVYRTTRALKVRPASPVAKMPPAWSSKRASSASQSSITVTHEWPLILPAERSSDATEDWEERTPLAACSPARSRVNTVESASRTPLLPVQVDKAREDKGPDFSARPPTPARVSPTLEVSVTPSKNQKDTRPAPPKRNLLAAAAGLFKHTARTPLVEKTAQPASDTLGEVSMREGN